MIVNKELNISGNDILLQNDLSILREWKQHLDSVLTSILNHHNADNWYLLPPKTKSAYRYQYSLNLMVRKRIGVIVTDAKIANGYVSERSKKRDRTLSNKFMEVAKRELNKTEYNRLLNIAKKELSANDVAEQ